ncbi:M10 family metallopeptidase C-terminal domain-containing protein [Roseovarius aestuarii]|nr:M10 family metallopeptidase C-terminal domain-containing protein [Roseovarius aestuarii]
MILTPSELSDRIDAILRADDYGNNSWGTPDGPAQVFTYRFETAPAADFMWADVGGGFSAFTSAYKATFRTVLDEISHYANITFVEDNDSAVDADWSFYRAADLHTNDVDNTGGGRGGWAYSGSEWDSSSVYNSALPLDEGYVYNLILHEIGHMLGLKHPGDYSAGGNPSGGPYLPANEESDRFTVMSYNTNPVTNQESRHYMLYDIAAMQQFWGANTSSNAGNDTYTGPDDGRVQVIWDTGGQDTFEFTGTGDAIIDLRQGAFSSMGATDNLAIAYDAVIENAIGNDGDDQLRGNSANNTLRGNDGDDTITADGGDDRVYDGSGADVVSLGDGDDYVRAGGGADDYDGGSGTDYISYYDSSGGVTLDLKADTASGSWANNDTIADFESASGSRTGDDNITGTSGANVIRTYGGDDRVYDGSGADLIELGSGDDYVRVGGGQDTYEGGSGTDYISYYDSSGGVTLDLEADTASGSWANNDTITSFESASGSKGGDDDLRGTSGSNLLRGYGGDDKLYGRSGDDTLSGGDGADRFDGGHGDDVLYGGDDVDVFHFDRGEDHDTIKDFENNVDLIELDNFIFAPGQDAFDFATQTGSDVVFDFGNGDMLTVEDVTIAQLYNDLDIV